MTILGITRTALAALVLAVLPASARPALAQPAGNQMCGDGTTFTVHLPGTTLGVDDSEGLFRKVNVPDSGPADSITLPNGCRIYALFVSGYGNNRQFTDIPFYKVAEFVARNDGYVHVAWWNNLLKEYLGGPLHPVDIVIRRLFGLLEDVVIPPGPSTSELGPQAGAFLPLPLAPDLPKANPDEDFQFQSDAAAMIRAIRQHNPEAIVIVAGHSMGGNAVARLGIENRDLEIDLLAPIDPVGNRDSPRGLAGTRTFNWTRWRVANNFRGYKQWDCVRNSLGLCRDFDSRLLFVRYECAPTGPFLAVRPVFASRAPVACPASIPYVDPGIRRGISSNIRHLYHRWQQESIWPVDFLRTERLNHPQPRSSSILGPNYQEPVPATLFATSPDATCRFGVDPRDPAFDCEPEDGHGEIIGHRGSLGELRPALQMRNWPNTPEGRRAAMIEMATADSSWFRRPQNPDLCMVCDDMIAIVQQLLDSSPAPTEEDLTAPVVLATATPGPNANGWNNEGVVVQLSATDEVNGSGVLNIETSLTGAQTGGSVHDGDAAEETIGGEGTTTLGYFARDAAGNEGDPAMLEVRIDRTAPQISAGTDAQPNASGWFNRSVVVSFPAFDEPGGSGLAESSEDVAVATEGQEQEVTGTATDRADNQATAAAVLNIDLTAPGISLAARTPAANAAGWNNSDVTVSWNCTDALSGPAAASVAQTLAAEGAGQSTTGTCADLADNTAFDTQAGISIDRTAPSVGIDSPGNGAAHLLHAAVTTAFGCGDSLSGVRLCAGPAPSGSPLGTATVGVKQFTVTSEDAAGNSANRTHAYSVLYGFSGFMPPASPLPAVNVAKAGRTVPIKWSLHDAAGAAVLDLDAVAGIGSTAVSCDETDGPAVEVEPAVATGDTLLRIEDGQFVFNWKTSDSWRGCRVLELKLVDGTSRTLAFRFR